MPTKIIVDCSTGQSTEVELTAEEIAQQEADAAAYAVKQAEQEAAEQARLVARGAAEQKLLSLGLTAEEIAALTK